MAPPTGFTSYINVILDNLNKKDLPKDVRRWSYL
jgi:hypothetical protein